MKPDMKCPEAKIFAKVEDVLSLAYLILNYAFKITKIKTTYVLTFQIAITKFQTQTARSSAKNNRLNHGNFLYILKMRTHHK